MKQTTGRQYVVLWPHSQTNPSNRFRVCDMEYWLEYLNHEIAHYPFTSFATHHAAAADCDKKNGVWV